MNKKANPIYGIRAKLISAVSMLLVAVIMVISSTYAWFTLSTAPEVKGINTAIGANGALEMALLKGNGAGGFVDVQNTQAPSEVYLRNYYWGNLVDVSDDTKYGSGSVTLLPSRLDLLNEGTKINLAGILSTPSYGTDGRVDKVEANTVTGTYDTDKKAFFENDDYGFRVVGTSSGMTDRELAYRNNKSIANSYMSTATNLAAKSLEADGGTLANIVIKKAESDDATYTQTEIASLNRIVNALLGTKDNEVDGVLEYIDQAYVLYLVSYAAATNAGNGAAYTALKGDAEAGTTLAELITKYESTYNVSLPTEIKNISTKLTATKANVTAAQTALEALTGDAIKWEDLSTPLYKLANVDAMTVNGWTASQISANQSGFVSQVLADQMKITAVMTTGGGVYADVADHCGDYSASVRLHINYGGITSPAEGIAARMEVTTTVAVEKEVEDETVSVVMPYLSQVDLMVNEEPFVDGEGEGAEQQPISEFYGYILDLAFRTNAPDSKLLLQTAPKDRVYADNAENNEFTWGGGSTMSFTSTTTTFSNDMMKSLLGHIRVVFFDTTTGEVFATAKLDTTNAENTANGFEAALYLIGADNNLITDQSKAEIKTLTQNVQTNISVLVYLDGETITNADVAAEAAASMTGKLNLQFSSSANLVPMEYGDYHVKSNNTPAETTPDGE